MLQRTFSFSALFALLSCFTPLCAPAGVDAEGLRIRELARSPRWLRLLHYKSHWFSGFRSSVDGAGFFFHPDGDRDPEKELQATLNAFRNQADENRSKLPQPPACAFPARYRFLREQLGLELPKPDCPRLTEFLSRFRDPESVTLVFSTAFPNNPASMFGHSFLRINAGRPPGREKHDLLDYGLSYAAQVPDDENNFRFVWLGLTGGYIGTFSSLPYYAKVQEYNASESRDLWEYELDFSPDETWWLLANAWELEVNGHSDYYFFDENCSYKILALIEAAKPAWHVADYAFHMIPGESVKKITRVPGAVRSVKFRPSLYRKLMALGDRLSAEERRSFHQLVRGEQAPPATLATLDTAAQYFYYLKQGRGGKLEAGETARFQRVLLARAALAQPSAPEPEFDAGSRPELGHHASRVSLGYGRQAGSGEGYGWFQELGFRFAYHDLLNHDTGFVPFSEISFPGISLRYFPEEQRFFVQQLQLLQISSLSPLNWLRSSLSWRAALAYEVPQDRCSFCHVMHLEGDVGASHSLAEDRLRAYEMAGLYVESGRPFGRASTRFTAGLVGNVTGRWKQQLELALVGHGFRLRPFDEDRFVTGSFGQSYFLSREWEARFLLKGILYNDLPGPRRKEGLLQLLTYF